MSVLLLAILDKLRREKELRDQLRKQDEQRPRVDIPEERDEIEKKRD